ncbi:MAG: DUF6152 family protein [Vicinamibacterales bacterium]
MGPKVSTDVLELRVAAARAVCGGATLVAMLTVLASAHHSAAPHFDLSQSIALTGVVSKFEFVNPHAYVYFTVRDERGAQVPWRCELPARTALGRLGWTQDTFAPGRTVTIKGAPARREEHVCMLTSFIREDGVEIAREQDLSTLRTASRAAPAAVNSASRVPTRLPDGHPNLAGPWVSLFGPGQGGPLRGLGPGGPGRGGPGRGGPGRGGPGRGGPGSQLEVTDAGAAAAGNYDQRFDDPAIKCSPANIIFGWTHDQHVNDVTHKGSTITLQYGYMDLVRTIHLNAEHPKALTPSLAGHSTGVWDGDVLVVDTVGFAPGVLIPISGVMHSRQMHVIERFSLDAGGTRLIRDFRVEDPLYLKAPYVGQSVMVRSAEPYTPYRCVELSGKNNVRPVK